MAEIKGDKLVNKVIFQVDNTSFNNCLNKIRKLKAEMKSFSKSCGSMGKGFGGFNVIGQQAGKVAEKMARAQARISAARVKQATAQMTAQNKELQSMRRFYREQEKLSARAAKQAAGIQASRRVQAVAGLTAKNPELDKMRAYYQQQEKSSSRLGNAAVVGAASRKNKILATNERMTGMFDGQVVAQFQRRMQSLNAKYKQGSISLGQYNARMAILRKEMAATAATAQRMQTSLNFSGLGAGIQSLNAKINSLLKGVAGLGMAGGYALQRMISGSMDAAATHNKTYFGLLAQNNDDKALTERQMGFTNRMANVYGLDKQSTGLEYMKFAGATKKTMSEDQRQQLFESLSIQSTAFGLDSQSFSFAIKALSQMSGKSKVTFEELRQQLGDHIPTAVQDFYEAWKKTTGKSAATMQDFEKAVKNGDVKLEQISGALSEIWSQAKNTEAYAKALQQPERALQRMKNSLTDLKVAFIGTVDSTDGVTTLAEHLINIFNHLSMVFGTSGEDATQFGSKVGEVLEGLVVDAEIIAFKVGDAITLVKTKLDEWGVTVKDVVEWVIKLKIGLSALSILSGVIGSIWKLRTALIALRNAANVTADGMGGGNGGGNNPGRIGGNVTKGNSLIASALQAHEEARAKYYAENPDAGNVDLTSIRSWIPKPLLGWWDHGTATGKFPDWFPGQGQAVTAPIPHWRDASLSTRLPLTPATVSGGNKVQINQQQVIKFDDNKLEGLIRVVSSEVTASSMGDMIDLINGGTESTRE